MVLVDIVKIEREAGSPMRKKGISQKGTESEVSENGGYKSRVRRKEEGSKEKVKSGRTE